MERTLYFAYGSNLDAAQMARRCPGAKPVGAAMLMDQRLCFPRTADDWHGMGVAGVEPAPGIVTDGAVYSVTDEHLAKLDEYEAVDEGCYRREWMTVMAAGVGPTKAWVYLAQPQAGGPFAPSAAYAGALMRGAQRFGLGELEKKMRRALRGENRPEWDVEALGQPPTEHEAATDERDVEAVYFDSVPWRGKPTRAFAFVGAPASDEPVPGVVLVHGGGGTAYAQWVRQWNARGYAAIAVDTAGGTGASTEGGRFQRHDHAGPPGWGGFDQIDEPVEDQWPYHAIANALGAHALLAARPGVDAKRIGLTGISWGGFLASILAGVDQGLRWCVPVYGCAFPIAWHMWLYRQDATDDQRRRWSKRWDPARWLVDARCPMRWVSNSQDNSFPVDQIDHSAQLPSPRASMTLGPGWGHSHVLGWAPDEIAAFADQHMRGGRAMLSITGQTVDSGTIEVRCAGQSIARAELCIADQPGPWIEHGWRTEPLTSEGDRVTATLPAGCGGVFVNVYDDRGLITSGRVVLGAFS